jgi:hypothetical protein
LTHLIETLAELVQHQAVYYFDNPWNAHKQTYDASKTDIELEKAAGLKARAIIISQFFCAFSF